MIWDGQQFEGLGFIFNFIMMQGHHTHARLSVLAGECLQEYFSMLLTFECVGNIVHRCQNRSWLQYSNMARGSILGPDVTLSQVSTSLFLIAFSAWILPFSIAHELFRFFFWPISPLFGHHNGTYQVAPEGSVASLTFSQLVLQPAIPSASLDCEDPAWPMGVFHPEPSGSMFHS